jgi:hypothetical protein
MHTFDTLSKSKIQIFQHWLNFQVSPVLFGRQVHNRFEGSVRFQWTLILIWRGLSLWKIPLLLPLRITTNIAISASTSRCCFFILR